MDNKSGLAAALAALMLAAGMDSAAAVGRLPAPDLGRIESSASIPSLRTELDALRSADPENPAIGMIIRRIVVLSNATSTVVGVNNQDVSGPY